MLIFYITTYICMCLCVCFFFHQLHSSRALRFFHTYLASVAHSLLTHIYVMLRAKVATKLHCNPLLFFFNFYVCVCVWKLRNSIYLRQFLYFCHFFGAVRSALSGLNVIEDFALNGSMSVVFTKKKKKQKCQNK